MTTPLIVGNWKMNTSLDDAITLAKATATASDAAGERVEVGICPPYPWLVPVADAIRGTSLRIGAQDCAATANGAHTGDVSATMLAESCAFTLVGHSERRTHHGETDAVVHTKLRRALDAGLGVILCVGETKSQHASGQATDVVRSQLTNALARLDPAHADRITVAYEPVWAIGTGDAATEQDAANMARAIRDDLDALLPGRAAGIRILYGGSANAENAAAFLAADGVDGLLVGGASLAADAFAAMIRAAAERQ